MSAGLSVEETALTPSSAFFSFASFSSSFFSLPLLSVFIVFSASCRSVSVTPFANKQQKRILSIQSLPTFTVSKAEPQGSWLHLRGAAGLASVAGASFPLSLGFLIPHGCQVRPRQATCCQITAAPSPFTLSLSHTHTPFPDLLAPLLGLRLACGWSLRVATGDSRQILLFLRKSKREMVSDKREKQCKCLSLSTFPGLNQSCICSSVVLNAVKGVLCVSILIMLYLWDKTLFRWPSPPELLPVLAEVTDGSSSLFP